MKIKKLILSMLGTSLVGFGIGYVFTNSTIFGLCSHNQYSCRDFFNGTGDPFFYGMGALALVFLLLLAVPQAFPAWKKFAIWFVPIAAILFATYSDPASGDFISPYPETVFKWVSALYVLISVIIIAMHSPALHTRTKK